MDVGVVSTVAVASASCSITVKTCGGLNIISIRPNRAAPTTADVISMSMIIAVAKLERPKRTVGDEPMRRASLSCIATT
jgi:hypothetical protein